MGCAFLLSVFANETRTAPDTLESELQHPLRDRELANALSYSLWHLQKRDTRVDPQWLVERRVQEARQQRASGSSTAQQLRDLQEMLGQMGFEIDVEAEAPQEVREQVSSRVETSGRQQVAYEDQVIYRPRTEPYLLDIRGRQYELHVWPITARPNLNTLSEERLRRYLVFLGLDETRARPLAAHIADWRDSDNLSRPEGGDGFTRVGDYAFEPPNAPIRSWDTLHYLPGAVPALSAFLREHFVLHGDARGVDPAFQSPEAIAALADLDVETVKRALDPPRQEGERIALEDVIGVSEARAFEAIVSRRQPDGQPVILQLRGGQLGVELVADPQTGQILARRPI